MREKCPNCGKPIEKQSDICPNCGFALSKASFQHSQTEQADEQQAVTGTTPEVDSVNDEAIEWADLKDMSLGHVMELFNEQNQEANAIDPEAESESEPISEKGLEMIGPAEANEAEQYNETVKVPKNSLTEAEIAIAASDDESSSAEEECSQLQEPVSTTQLVIFEEKTSETPTNANEAGDHEAEEWTPNETLQAYIAAHKSSELPQSTVETMTAQTAEEGTTPVEEGTEKNLPAVEVNGKNEESSREEGLASSSHELPPTATATEEENADESSEQMLRMESATASIEAKSEEPADCSLEMDQAHESRQPKTYKKSFLTIAAIAVVGAGAWAVYNQSHASKANSQTTSSEVRNLARQIQKQIDSYYLTTKKQLIKPEQVRVSLAPIQKNLKQLKDEPKAKELTQQYQTLKEQIGQINQVNALFDAPIIDGDKLSSANLAADQAIQLGKFKGTEPLQQLLNQAIDRALQQYNQLQKAKQAVAEIYQNGQATPTLTRATYNTAKNQVDQVASTTLKKELLAQLEKAEQTLATAEAAAVTKEQETQASEKTTTPQKSPTTAKTEANGYSAPNSHGIYTDPLYPTDPNDVADTTNSAWTWNPGVKEKVIATAIQRGYIVEGGYQLEPAKIVNGEGYYNLYATNNRSSLLSGLPDGQQHVYLVTINAKTGWFKGNASRNAGR